VTTLKKSIRLLLLIVVAAMMLSGCVIRTVDELYCLPKRSQSDDDMQAVIDSAMTGLSYCAPLYGQNRQMMQPADLDGDGVEEYVVLARGGFQKQLKILIFDQYALGYALAHTIENYGTAFDFIEFANVDNHPGLEIVVGRQMGDGVVRSAAVYRYGDGMTQQLLEVGYGRIITCDMDEDGRSELVAIRPGDSGEVRTNLVLYRYDDGQLRANSQLDIDISAGSIKKMDLVVLQDGNQAVLVVSEEQDSQMMELVAIIGNQLHHVYGPAVVDRLHNHFVYPMDADGDGDTELPELVGIDGSQDHSWIRWFGVDAKGSRTDGMYTYYSYADKWYIHMDRSWISKLTVSHSEGICTFSNQNKETVMTIYALTGVNRKEQAQQLGGVVLGSSEYITFAATIGPGAEELGITEQRVRQLFYAIDLKLYTEEE
jgi:hypothetical protein